MKSILLPKHTYIIGIDEVGRGPLAGPVAVGAVIFWGKAVPKKLRPGKDSKKLSVRLREEWFTKIQMAEGCGELAYAVSFVSSKIIDSRGLRFAIRKALATSLQKVFKKRNVKAGECYVLLDGGLSAPAQFPHQKTIIKGDEKEPIISLASIAAKVLRDRKMCVLAKKYPNYDFEVHKGYGTAGHYKKIKQHGLSPIHRRSFLKKLVN